MTESELKIKLDEANGKLDSYRSFVNVLNGITSGLIIVTLYFLATLVFILFTESELSVSDICAVVTLCSALVIGIFRYRKQIFNWAEYFENK